MLTLTPITWTVRSGPAHVGYGAPYEGVATVQRCGDVAHVSAACGALPIRDQCILSGMLKGMGFSAIVFERVKDGEMKTMKRQLGAKLTGEREQG